MSAASSPPLLPRPQIEALSSNDGSSPLSDVEVNDDGDQDEIGGLHDNDEESVANDTEAETERLFDTPQVLFRQKDIVMTELGDDQASEKTPTGSRQRNSTQDDDEPLSELNSSPPLIAQDTSAALEVQSPTLDVLAEAAATQETGRKRKQPSEEHPEEPTHKRAQSPEPADQDGDIAMADEEDVSTNPHSTAEHSADEGVNVTEDLDDDKDNNDALTEAPAHVINQKQTRSSAKKRKGPQEEAAEGDEPPEEAPDGTIVTEDGTHTDDHDHIDPEEEAEAAHKEEELERKRAAFDQLKGIEQKFASFREKLYETRLQALEKEEQMFKDGTHPEYLAMMQCIDARKDERIQVAENELRLSTEAAGRWAVARRTQIHSQFFQDVRESREHVLAELGQQWYRIQHERRKNANNVPDFGLRYPKSQAEQVRSMVAYNKEVSILSGIAKYQGMPAAPEMRGASQQELDDDLDAINQAKQPPIQPPRALYPDYSLPFGQGLGAAGEQFLEETPWANPNHPSHAHLVQQRQPSVQHEPLQKGSPHEERRHSNQAAVFSSSTISTTSNNQGPPEHPPNGKSTSKKNAPCQPSNSPEVTRAASLLESARTFKVAAEQGPAVKRENVSAVGGF